MTYSDFANKSLKEFIPIQEVFRAKYRIDDYSNWFYNQATELLTLSTDKEEINFKYIPIGTYSTKSKTWMWAWNKSDSIEKSKDKTLKIKQFGLREDYRKLKEGYFESNKFEGWEFVAISNKILKGIGGYKVNSEHLEIYFLIQKKIDNDLAKQIKEEIIECESHGVNRIAFVCQHLIKASDKGFEEAFPTFYGMELEEDDDLQAWCDACEIERLKTDGWNEESTKFANIKIVCEKCYFEIKTSNSKK